MEQIENCKTTRETYLSMVEAAQNRSLAKRVSPTAPWRWARKGILARNGERVFLQHRRSGGVLFTTQTWLDDFLTKLTAADSEHFSCPKPVVAVSKGRTPRQRKRAVSKARSALAAAGVREAVA